MGHQSSADNTALLSRRGGGAKATPAGVNRILIRIRSGEDVSSAALKLLSRFEAPAPLFRRLAQDLAWFEVARARRGAPELVGQFESRGRLADLGAVQRDAADRIAGWLRRSFMKGNAISLARLKSETARALDCLGRGELRRP
jgi:hypothetical protein